MCARVCTHAGIIGRLAGCSVIFSTYSDCFPALLLWCLTLLFSLPVYFRQRMTLYCSAPARFLGRVTEQERIRPSHPKISSHRDERRCVNTPLFPSRSVFLHFLTFLFFFFHHLFLFLLFPHHIGFISLVFSSSMSYSSFFLPPSPPLCLPRSLSPLYLSFHHITS